MKRKWLFAIIILIVVGVVLTIVFVNLFGEHATTNLAKSVNSTVTTGYLSEDSEQYETVNEYFDKIYDSLSESDQAEVKNYQDSYKTFVVAGNFYNRQLVFAKYTNVYKDKRKVVENAFGSAQKEIERLVDYIKENDTPINGTSWWQATTWVNCKDFVKEWFNQNAIAFTNLKDIFASTMQSKIVNNDLTILIFDTFDDMAEKIKENASKDDSLGEKLLDFVQNYLTVENEKNILVYEYSQSVKNAVADIKEKGLENSDFKSTFLTGALAG